jgi:uncharacterized protein (TIGR02246 family)
VSGLSRTLPQELVNMRNTKLTSACVVIVACVVLAASCGSTVAQNDASAAIPAALKMSSDAWNNGDLAGHIRDYADAATFMGGNGPIQGRDRVGEALAKSFWRDGKPKQQLSFDRIEVRPLGDRHALVTGHFLLTGGGEADRSGWFSLTYEKTPSGWHILHDHSS